MAANGSQPARRARLLGTLAAGRAAQISGRAARTPGTEEILAAVPFQQR